MLDFYGSVFSLAFLINKYGIHLLKAIMETNKFFRPNDLHFLTMLTRFNFRLLWNPLFLFYGWYYLRKQLIVFWDNTIHRIGIWTCYVSTTVLFCCKICSLCLLNCVDDTSSVMILLLWKSVLCNFIDSFCMWSDIITKAKLLFFPWYHFLLLVGLVLHVFPFP